MIAPPPHPAAAAMDVDEAADVVVAPIRRAVEALLLLLLLEAAQANALLVVDPDESFARLRDVNADNEKDRPATLLRSSVV